MTKAHKIGIQKLAIIVACATLVLGGAKSAWAVLLAYEGFDYAPSTLLPGLNGGSGWAGAWDETQAASFDTATQASSLTYTDSLGNALTTSGGKLFATGSGGSSQPGRTLSARRASPESSTISTWISFLGNREGPLDPPESASPNTYRRGANLALFDLGGSAAQAEKINLGESSNVQYPVTPTEFEDRWQSRFVGIPGAVTFDQPYPPNPTGAPTAGQARDAYSEVPFADLALFVMRIDHVAGDTNAATTGGTNGGNDNVFIWMNPNLNTTPLDANASIKYVSTDIVTRANTLGVAPYSGTPMVPDSSSGGEINFDRLRLFAGNVNGVTPFAEWLFDELRVGETFADVTPHTPVAAGVQGDYNGNNIVDAADYVLWRNGGPLQNDPTPGVQPEDYDFWKARFGATSGSGSVASSVPVPEPASWLLAALTCGAVAKVGRNRRRNG